MVVIVSDLKATFHKSSINIHQICKTEKLIKRISASSAVNGILETPCYKFRFSHE